MSVRKKLALSVVSWVALGGLVRADAIMEQNSSSQWHLWMINSRVIESDLPFAQNVSNGDTVTFGASTGGPFVGSGGSFNQQSAQLQPQPTTNSTPSSSPDPATTSASSSSSTTTTSSSSGNGGTVNANINFNGPYPEFSSLTTGSAQPWYDSPVVQKVFGGTPTLSQQNDFMNQVYKDVQATFQASGLNPSLTLDGASPANHTLSVVSGVSYAANPDAIGITDVGQNGFSFIDKFAYASQGQINQFEWAVAHNISHELMHAFGVAVHHDTTGQYLDAASANWSQLSNQVNRADPASSTSGFNFSPAAVADIQAHLNGAASQSGNGSQGIDGDEILTAQPVPEPATIALWGLGATAVLRLRRRRAA